MSAGIVRDADGQVAGLGRVKSRQAFWGKSLQTSAVSCIAAMVLGVVAGGQDVTSIRRDPVTSE